ncbi:hypothetical protein BEP19_00800 [Ammoniphilus oxalaticus]|uniref:CNNM transmembrane domain-containing protein n=1 Tax=Ammoniphilus oxalaticus TaxID=66863 RepID=A0A419SMI7_9BACL|nr:hypothetical protein [Ammoniphilus oxalaticus]RKD25516.1 hypothetical protein BEP19_00800 [Ammoniphilus oxalaticus]
MSRKTKKNGKKKYRIFTRWSFIISIWTFFTAVGVSMISELLLRETSLLLAILTLLCIVVVGTVADVVAVAITAAELSPFNSMAAKKVYGARKGIEMIQNAEKYANFFGDVVGDVLGYVAGMAGATLVFQIIRLSDQLTMHESVVSILVAGVSSAAIVGSKAVGKNIALHNSTEIVLGFGKLLTFLTGVKPKK